MQVWILITVVEREIVIQKYSTYSDAFDAMLSDVKETIEFNPYDIDEQKSHDCYKEEDYDISDFVAWSNVREIYADWQIERIM
ncbi:MAG TPA: hypothetical protein DCW90_09385 [Lachnospiraceae bacterium]|nr:hypothetical protein [Lachnospiraceae bacterium]